MISGTEFTIEDPHMVSAACRGVSPNIASASEIAEMAHECENAQALCLACGDGMIVVDVRPNGADFEMFVRLAIAFRHGAVERQDAALRSIARDLGAQTIAFESRRRGWARRLGPEWQRRGSREFVRSVN